MAGLTKDELKSALISHGVDMSFTNAKKDDLVALYDEYVAPYDVGNFSSDDEAAVVSPTKTKKTSRSSKKSASSSATNGEKKKRRSGKITEENSMIVGEIKVDELSDEDLIGYLKYYGIEVGPVVDSTRSIYQKKLAIVMRENEDQEEEVDSAANGHDNNGHHAEADNVNGSLNKSMTIGEFSADEEMEVNTEDEEQPSAVVRKSARKPTPKKTSSSSAKKEATSPMQSLRQRFGGTTAEDKSHARFTPTPRRSIHSYKITETTKQTMVKTPDGVVTHDLTYNKETSESKGILGGNSRAAILFKILPGVFMLLIIVALVYYVNSRRT